MTIKSGQKMYRVRDPDGLWIRKGADGSFHYVQHEEVATFWKKLSHLKNAISTGIFADETKLGLPREAFKVVEYIVTIERTGRKERLTEVNKFYPEKVDAPKEV